MLIRPTLCRGLLLQLSVAVDTVIRLLKNGHKPQTLASEIVNVVVTSNTIIASMNVL